MDAQNFTTLNYLAKNISYVTPFDGNKNSLLSFLNRIEPIIPLINTLDVNLQHVAIGYILDKIIGRAKENLVREGIIENWESLKATLVRNHGEKTKISDLFDELKTLRCDSNIQKFYEKINNLLFRINNSHQLNGTANIEDIKSNNRIALKQFAENLPPLARNLVLCRNPTTLDEAYDLIVTSGYLTLNNNPRSNTEYYFNKRNFNQNKKYHNNNKNSNYSYNQTNNINNRQGQYNLPQYRTSNQTYHPNNNQNTSTQRTQQTHRTNNSNISRYSRNSHEPMDILYNKSTNNNNHNSNTNYTQPNFHSLPRKNYPI